jgi:hypothetical protein
MKTPQGDFLGDRRRALEESFFAERDRLLLDKLRGELSELEERRHLAHVSGVLDEKVLQDLVASGVRAETLAAVRLIPLVEVAWCDGKVSAAERSAVLKASIEYGIQEGTACYSLLDSWLQNRPDSRVVGSWKDYVGHLAKMMPPESMQKLRDELANYLKKVATAAGGILGMKSISKKEQDTIDELIQATRV